jgi:hypothetical protein
MAIVRREKLPPASGPAHPQWQHVTSPTPHRQVLSRNPLLTTSGGWRRKVQHDTRSSREHIPQRQATNP